MSVKSAENTKRKVLETAEVEFSEKGLYGSRVDSIAERSGVNKKQIYEYFGKKEELYMRVLSEVYNRPNKGEQDLVLKSHYEPSEMIRRIVAMYFVFLQDNPRYVKLLLWENLNEARYLKQAGCVGERRFAFEALKKYFVNASENGSLRNTIDAEDLVVSLNMFCFSYYSNIYSLSCLLDRELWSDREIDRHAALVSDMIWAYISK